MINRMCKNATKFVENNSTNILTGLGMAGVVTTAIFAAKATPKAEEMLQEKEEFKINVYDEELTKFEKVLAVAPAYLPAILMGAATMSCIYGANHINKKQQAVLTGAYSYLANCYDEYKTKVAELHGVEFEKEVRDAIAKDKYELEQLRLQQESNKQLYYDEYSQRYFYLHPDELKCALYEINRIFLFNEELCLNDVYEFLGLEPTDYGGTVGWAVNKEFEFHGTAWIDFNIDILPMPDNLDCKVLTFDKSPSADYEQWYW